MDQMESLDEFGQWKETLRDLLSETFLQVKENCHGSLSFIEQNEENTTNNALETLALFREPLELQTPK